MNNFELYNPVNYIFGKDQVQKLAELVPANAKVLIAYGGGSIFKNGVHEAVTKALKGFEVVEFGGIEPNPHFETLMKAVQLIREQNIDFILAVGGGSVIDGVKFISAAVHYDGDAADILRKRILFKAGAKVIPFGTVLTLPATGSEMNSGAVVTIAATQEKLTLGGSALFPKFSIVDPTVIISLPKRQLQNGVVDAFTHVMEQYLTYPHEAFLQDRFAESILKTLIEIGPNVVENPSDYILASNFVWCATMALNGLIQKGVPSDWATHMIGHELTALYQIDHARTLAIIGPNLYKVMFETKKEKLAQYGKRVWNLSENSVEENAQKAIEKTIEFFHIMGMKTKISENAENIENTAEMVVKRFQERGWNALGERQNITLEKVQEIVEMSY
ncbi:iron-containing alcohol dehydrogenase [Flavobacterium aciduliphilum]|uniref:NADP-dependent alcohol dehydrogenase n=1 Tax=Flavobacterium aciduliphilum TaxID=1101402 RepID=A0A328YB77_9FLAO|nr:iron-containing alcohol dehydrogenase [Flavobacterium aciduliphilum]RAR71301.1 NADP-dependent alcohol dehydrogenase [Flavobacterium aciduliphilum]